MSWVRHATWRSCTPRDPTDSSWRRWSTTFRAPCLAIYDMLPMMYAPQQTQLPQVKFVAPIPDPTQAPIWEAARVASREFWATARTHALVSADFFRIAAGNMAVLDEVKGLGDLLPVATRRAH